MRLIITDAVTERRKRMVALAERMTHCVTVLHQLDSGRETLELAARAEPDLLLIHSELADMPGLDVFRALPETRLDQVVLIASNSEDAERAFEAGVRDCLLQPVTFEAFVIAVLRARRPVRSTHFASEKLRSVDSLPAHGEQLASEYTFSRPFLVGEREHRLYPFDPDKIDYIESAGNYVKYHVGTLEYIARESVKHLEEQLCQRGFLRIERCLLLNIRSIAYAEPVGQAIFAFTLMSGTQLHSGPAYREAILQILPLRRRPSTRGGRRPHPLNIAPDHAPGLGVPMAGFESDRKACQKK